MKNYVALARRWSQGWELHVDGVGVTQSRTLEAAEREVRDYIGSLEDTNEANFAVEVRPELGGLAEEIAELRAAQHKLVDDQFRVGRASRALAQRLRDEQGLSVSDIATVMEVSRGRVSQLLRPVDADSDRAPATFSAVC